MWWFLLSGTHIKENIQRYHNNVENEHITINLILYTGCPRRNVPDFGRVFLMLKYTDITQNTCIQSWTVTEIMAREVWNFDSCYTLRWIQHMIRNKTSFYGELSTPRPTPKLEDHPFSAFGDGFFNIFAATLHTAGRSSILNPRTRHVTWTHLSRFLLYTLFLMCFQWRVAETVTAKPAWNGTWCHGNLSWTENLYSPADLI